MDRKSSWYAEAQLRIGRGGSRRRLAALVVAALGVVASAADAQVAPGYEADAIAVAPAGAFVGGMCILSNGHYALYDGSSVIEVDATDGSFVQTLYTPVGMPFGSFLVLGPTGGLLYFGESSIGTITEIDLFDLSNAVVGKLSLPYDFAFDGAGRAFVSWSLGFGFGSTVSHIDLVSGTLTEIVDSDDASGPIAFDADGGMFYGFPDTSAWPPPLDGSKVVSFTKAQIDSTLAGGSPWLESDGVLVAQVDGVADFAVDESGDLFVTDSSYDSLTEIDAKTGAERVLFDGPDFQGLTYLVYEPAAVEHAFEAYQRSGSGTLVALATDYFSFNDALRIQPSRATLKTTPASPVPVGPFDLELTGGVPDGNVLLFVTRGVGAEFRGSNASWPAPLWWGLDFSGGILLLQSFPLDSAGALILNADNPGLGGFTIGVQGVLSPTGTGPFYGTTSALELTLQ